MYSDTLTLSRINNELNYIRKRKLTYDIISKEIDKKKSSPQNRI